jgi:hypothetical protein
MSVIFRFPGGLWLGGFLAVSGALCGQTTVTPQGSEFPIIASLPGDQVWPTVSLTSTGGCLAWQDNAIQKSGGSMGTAVLSSTFEPGANVRINNTTTGNHLRPKVQLLANGNIVYVWESKVPGTTPSIYARFAKANQATASKPSTTAFYTGDVRVNTYLTGEKANPAVAALPDGTSIVVWQSWGQDGSMNGVFARRLKSTGAGETPKEFQVNQFTPYNQRNPAVAALANGNYVIAWVSEQERALTNTDVDVYARIFSDAGVPQGDGYEIPINTGSSTFSTPCSSPAIAPLSDGGFTVVWAQKDLVTPTNGFDIWGRAFSPTGAPLGPDFEINTYLYGDQYQPKIAAGPAGSLVVWTSLNQDGSREGVFGRFLAGGTQVSGNEFQVNTTTIASQMHPSVAWDGVGQFLVVWTSFTGQQGYDLFGQWYTVNSSQ